MKTNFKSFGILLLLALFAISYNSLSKQDTVEVTYESLISEFEQHNVNLKIALKDIQSASEYVDQEETWENPRITFESIIYDPTNKNYFQLKGDQGQYLVQIQQLVSLFGKKSKMIDLAKIQKNKFHSIYEQIEKTLRYELSVLIITCYYDQQSLKIYDDQIANLYKSEEILERDLLNDSISLEEYTRIKFFILNLENERNDLITSIMESQEQINIITGMKHNNYLRIKFDLETIENTVKNLESETTLLEFALKNRKDISQAKVEIELSKKNYELQKAISMPDLTLGLIYDKNSNFIPDYTGINFSFDLPIFNFNSGNIAASLTQIEANNFKLQQIELQAKSEVSNLYAKFINTNKILSRFDKKSLERYNSLHTIMNQNLKSKKMDIIQYLDFFDLYKNTKIQYNILSRNRIQTLFELLYICGKN